MVWRRARSEDRPQLELYGLLGPLVREVPGALVTGGSDPRTGLLGERYRQCVVEWYAEGLAHRYEVKRRPVRSCPTRWKDVWFASLQIGGVFPGRDWVLDADRKITNSFDVILQLHRPMWTDHDGTHLGWQTQVPLVRSLPPEMLAGDGRWPGVGDVLAFLRTDKTSRVWVDVVEANGIDIVTR